MTAADLAPIISALNYQTMLIFVLCFLAGFLCLIEFIRLVIVLYRSVKGRMDRV